MFPADASFTVFDVETTGLAPKSGDRIVEIAGVRVEGGMIRRDRFFVSLVNPERRMSYEAGRINRISEEELVHAPTIAEVLPKFLSFAEGTILVAHNAEFDQSFLETEKEMCWGYMDIPECLCTLALSRAVHPRAYRHTLGAVAERLGLAPSPVSGHRALPDVLLTAEVLLRLITIGDIRSLDALRAKALPGQVAWR